MSNLSTSPIDNEMVLMKCFETTFGECFNNPDTFPDILFEFPEKKHFLYAHRVILCKVRFFKNLFDLETKQKSPTTNSSTNSSPTLTPNSPIHNNNNLHKLNNNKQLENGKDNNSKLIKIQIQENPIIFSLLIKYFYSGYIQCQVNQLSELLVLAHRFQILPVTIKIRKCFVLQQPSSFGNNLTTTNSSTPSSSLSPLNALASGLLLQEPQSPLSFNSPVSPTSMTLNVSSIVNLPMNTKMTLQNAIILWIEIVGNPSIEGNLFRSELFLAKRVLLRNAMIGTLFTHPTITKLSLLSMKGLLDFLGEYIHLIVNSTLELNNNNDNITMITNKDIMKGVLKWMYSDLKNRVFVISDLYQSMQNIMEKLNHLLQNSNDIIPEMVEFKKSVDVLAEQQRKLLKLNTATKKKDRVDSPVRSLNNLSNIVNQNNNENSSDSEFISTARPNYITRSFHSEEVNSDSENEKRKRTYSVLK